MSRHDVMQNAHQTFVCISLAKRTFYGIKLQLQREQEEAEELELVGVW